MRPLVTGDRVKLTREGRHALGHIQLKFKRTVRFYDSAIRGTVQGRDRWGDVEVKLDGYKKVRAYKPEYWEPT